VQAFGDELDPIRFDIAASVRAEKEGEAAKRATVSATAIDNEMKGGTKHIAQLIKDEVNLQGMSKLPHASGCPSLMHFLFLLDPEWSKLCS
jgi:hypothetical protein